ncbi:MAG: hypothetical protein A3K19_25880 [Lentisphaerae bacterium RIFOXYB12_FULL_65_16]|nr:MAG: hypothetical protein A3K18_31880 [Lentisphaerae bacterium RIFOXYA12_64_32]OGV91401.1 MAG: hypothetical protein A3K19_25880 [Lentisphaerae bacterium RIFOXYB12_FULL_65_16]
MPADLFVDTNILVYAHDRDAGRKHARARALVESAWREDSWPHVSVQVLQELFVNLHRKGLTVPEARATVADYAQWPVVQNTVALIDGAADEMTRWRLSFWDSLILAAARSAGASVIWSEDLSDTQDYDGIHVENPLA